MHKKYCDYNKPQCCIVLNSEKVMLLKFINDCKSIKDLIKAFLFDRAISSLNIRIEGKNHENESENN